ncbi:MAG: NRDE family protein [Gammaproteobacteria bacterium]|nr:NRDE family protein [Gammaproteobacteria bacterium]MDE2460768.1 NRDE family protein [Gammaproteobacteria bacterium]
MCIAVFAWKIRPDYPLVFAGNRDELHARPAAAAGYWKDAPQVLAGRDLTAGGTWLGVTAAGRFAVVTNYREGLNPKKMPRSRGELTADFLQSAAAPQEYLAAVQLRAHEYAPFSLIVGDAEALWYFSNRDARAPFAILPGIHGLSNHLLDTPWPKVTLSKSRLETLLARGMPATQELEKLLADRTEAPANELPDTGIGAERERQISPVFVVNPVYGTRCSTAIVRACNGELHFVERRFDAAGQFLGNSDFHLAGDSA